MSFTQATMTLTHHAVMTMLQAGIAKAQEIGQPQCIHIVDASGETLGEIRMTGAKFLSRKSARAKARTSASISAPSDSVPEAVRLHISAATESEVTGLAGGLPILLDGAVLGGIGVGSGSPDQDLAVANSALAAVGAKTFDNG